MRAVENFIIIVDEKGKLEWVSPNSRALFQQGIQESLFDIIQDVDRPSFERALAIAMDSGREERMSVSLVGMKSDGTPASLWIAPLEGSVSLCSVVISRPIPESDSGFLDLQSFVLTFDRAMDGMNSAVISADRHGRIIMLNHVAEEISGHSTKEVVGEQVTGFFSLDRDSRAEIEKVFKEVMTGKVRNVNAPLLTKNGKTVDQSWRVSYSEIGEEGEGIMMLFGYDPSRIPQGSKTQAEIDENLSLLISRSAELAGALDPSGKIDEELMRMVDAQSLNFGLIRVEDQEKGFILFPAGLSKEKAEGIILSPSLDLKSLSASTYPSVIELDPWAHRGKMPQEVNSILHIPLGVGSTPGGFALFGAGGSVRGWESRTPILQIFCNQAIASLRQSDLIKKLARRTIEVQSLYEVSQILSSTLDLDTLLDEVEQKGRELANSDLCEIYRIDDDSETLTLLKGHIADDENYETQLSESTTIEAIQTGKSVITNESSMPGAIAGQSCSVMSLPLIMAGELSGAMTLMRRGAPFTERDLQTMELFSTAAAMALRNASLYERLNQIAGELQAYNDLLAHDVANFNVPIHGYLEMLLTDPSLDEKHRGYIWRALKQSENITSLVTNVRRLAEIRLSEGKTYMKPLDIVPILARVVSDVSDDVLCKGTPINYEAKIETALVLADEDVREIFINLLKNACQFGKGEPVDISISPHTEDGEDYWRVDFIDRGKGIPDEWKERIFHRFWETDSDRRAEAKGLGLSVVSALCYRYGGRVWAGSRVDEDPSQGSIFSVIIPKSGEP